MWPNNTLHLYLIGSIKLITFGRLCLPIALPFSLRFPSSDTKEQIWFLLRLTPCAKIMWPLIKSTILLDNPSYLSFSSLSLFHQLLSCSRDGTPIHHEVTCRITRRIEASRRAVGWTARKRVATMDGSVRMGEGDRGRNGGRGAGGSRSVGGWRVTHNGRAALIRPDHSHRTNVFYCPEA